MISRIKPILSGIKTYIPGLCSFKGGEGRTSSARYCYSVFLRHIYVLYKNGMNKYPEIIAELGPGGSIGIGLAGLISGAEKYYALDVVEHASNEQNVRVFDELISLFESREDIPGDEELPRIYPKLANYRFVTNILTEDMLKKALNGDRIKRLRNNIINISSTIYEESSINYIVPWFNSKEIRNESVDIIYSQAVLEHVDDLENAYRAMSLWLKKDGIMSHQIDFKSHGITDKWNGHWTYSDSLWEIIKGKRPYLLNREPVSTHIKLLNKLGFKVLCVLPVRGMKGFKRSQLARRFKDISDEDFTTSSVHIVSKKE